MDCDEVRDRLVAWQDGELPPASARAVAEHLSSCLTCARQERALRRATPHDGLHPPPDVLRRLRATVTADAVLAEAEARDAARPPPWWRRSAGVSRAAAVAYAATLVAALGFGVHHYLSAAALQAQLDAAPLAPSAAAPATGAIPADQYRPAAYTPHDGEVSR